ncbi:hypothetical protein [Deinococcus multiflagellatus]|uniref:Uncharacterized protein n=1 Tax=Deinococcus multiflagellatus TaxID=1656887 RepID=A0ABW1ZFQ3_9DEIO|nr:hypothetical protein [Deinococcus multiflagellatus]MBZ9712203.1 hypothetical protein [Deinococcus multiflagellatus]
MPRKPRSYVDQAARRITRGTVHNSPAFVIRIARTEEFWNALLDGQRGIFWSRNGKKARRKVVRRHPVKH